jgi:hypothetical protein
MIYFGKDFFIILLSSHLVLFSFQCCATFLSAPEITDLLTQKFDLMIIDGILSDCALGLHYRMDIPFIYFNTISFFIDVLSSTGNPTLYSGIPIQYLALSDRMGFFQRLINFSNHVAFKAMRIVRIVIFPLRIPV